MTTSHPGIWGYLRGERDKWIESYYYVFTTITTVGYGDIGFALAKSCPAATHRLFVGQSILSVRSSGYPPGYAMTFVSVG